MASKAQVLKAMEEFSLSLHRKRNVVGFGVVPVEGGARGDLALAIYVSMKVPVAELAPEDRLPSSVQLKSKLKTVDVPVQVIEQGEVSLEGL